MSYLAKQKLSYYKKYKLDIWGLFRNTLQTLQDNTIYRFPNGLFTLRIDKKIKNSSDKELLDLKIRYVKAKTIYQKNVKNKISKNYKSPGSISTDYEKYAQKKKDIKELLIECKIIHKRILLSSLLYNYIFKLGISLKMNKIFLLFLSKKKLKQRIYFRRPFIYETREPIIRFKTRRMNYQFVSLRVIKLFYVMYSYRQLKQIARKAKSKFGVFEQNYLYIMECKLPSYIYRTSLFSNLFESIKFVKGGNVWINKQFKPLLYYSVKLYDIVGFRVVYKGFVFWNFYKRLRRKAFMYLFSRCIYVSMTFLFSILIHMFTKKDIINSFNVDYYRVANYAQ
jgi:ribosomal protein S4